MWSYSWAHNTAGNAYRNVKMLTNLKIDTTTSINNFLIMYPDIDNQDWTEKLLSVDIKSESYKDDKASNLRF